MPKIQDVIAKELKGLWGDSFSNDGIPVIKTNNMAYDGRIDYTNICKRNVDIKEAQPNFLHRGDLLIEKSGGTKTHSVGYVNYFDGEDDKFLCNNFILALRPNEDLVNPSYLFWQLQYMYEIGKFSDCFNKTTGIQNLQKETYLNKEIKIHSKSEQKAISDYLNKIREGIILKEKQLKFMEILPISIFIEEFGSIDISSQNEEWPTLGEVSEVYTGTTPSTSKSENWDGDVLWITPAEITDDSFFISDTERKITETGRKSKSLQLMPPNTVLLSTRAPIGKVAITKKEMTCNQGFKNFFCNEKILNPVYLYFVLKNNTEYLSYLGNGTTYDEISKSNIKKLRLPISEITLQEKFAEDYLKIHKEKLILKKELNKLSLLLESTLAKYFD